MPDLSIIPRSEFERVASSAPNADVGLHRLALLAQMCRYNTLTAVKRAGSGHLGSSFSSLDVVAHLLWEEMSTAELGWEHPDRDVFFSSKGHDVPGLYAALYALGVISQERFLRLRRLGGLDGHPDVGVPGIEANSGSLGMGISKGRGIAWAKTALGCGGRVFVMTGDGELQEGQNYEGLQAAAHQRVGNLIAIVDCNELQSDKLTSEILDLGEIEEKFRTFGWHTVVLDGHDHDALRAAFREFDSIVDRPKAIVARTVKGKGVSFMEHPRALAEGGGTYRWHAGAPGDEDFERAAGELRDAVGAQAEALGLGAIAFEPVELEEPASAESLEGEPESGAGARLAVTDEYVAEAYGQALLDLAARNERLVVLDADLASDCRVRGFELAHPERFIEVGIAEQDMVSMAGGLARQGFVPVVNSFASFLASRANEQIYNNATEKSKVVYALHYAGLIPAGPGKSHQSIRDISLLAALPNMTIVQPANSAETAALLGWAIEDAVENVAIRLAIGPSPRRIELPVETVTPGRGSTLREGGDGVVLAYGPVMLAEAVGATELLADRGHELTLVNMPWLNRVDRAWLETLLADDSPLFVVEDHAPVGGLGDTLRRAMGESGAQNAISVFGVEGYPACGTPTEALRFHGLDAASLAGRIASKVASRA